MVRWSLVARKFFCDRAACHRQVFTERLPEVTAPYARKTGRRNASYVSPVSFRTMERMAALASMVEASTPIDTTTGVGQIIGPFGIDGASALALAVDTSGNLLSFDRQSVRSGRRALHISSY